MLSPPAPRTFDVAEVEVASYLNSIRDALTFLTNPPVATVFQTASQSISISTTTAASFDSTAVDTYSMHSNTVNPSRCVAQVAGYYSGGGSGPMLGNGGTYRKAQLYVNGAAVAYGAAQVPPVASGSTATNVPVSPTLIYLNVGDYATFDVTADLAVTLTPNGSNQAYMTLQWAHA